MPHREAISFPEFSKKMFEERDGEKPIRYPSDVKKAVVGELNKVAKAREKISALQASCAHERETVNLAETSVRRTHQCMDCGLTRHTGFSG